MGMTTGRNYRRRLLLAVICEAGPTPICAGPLYKILISGSLSGRFENEAIFVCKFSTDDKDKIDNCPNAESTDCK